MNVRGFVVSLGVVCGIAACKAPAKEDAKPKEAAPQVNTTPAELKPTGCDPAPKWVGLDACHEDGWVYAVGRKKITSSKPLAKAVVAAKARAAVARAARVMDVNERYILEDSEVLYAHMCNDEWVAIGRMKKQPPPALPACPAKLFEQAPPVPEHCPDWTTRIGWKEGDTYVGVGMSQNTHNPTQAPAEAKARALAQAQAVLRSVVGVDGDSATIPHDSGQLVEGKLLMAACGDIAYAHVSTTLKK